MEMRRIKKLFTNLNIRSKLIVLNGIFLLSIIILGSVVNLMLKASQTMSIIISEDRYFVENFSFGKEFFLRYEISGKEEDLSHSLEHFNKAYKIAYYFSVTDSVLENMREEEWKPFLFEIFKEGVNYKMNKLELMANPDKSIS